LKAHSGRDIKEFSSPAMILRTGCLCFAWETQFNVNKQRLPVVDQSHKGISLHSLPTAAAEHTWSHLPSAHTVRTPSTQRRMNCSIPVILPLSRRQSITDPLSQGLGWQNVPNNPEKYVIKSWVASPLPQTDSPSGTTLHCTSDCFPPAPLCRLFGTMTLWLEYIHYL
jgi:hypothetical protein